VVVLPDGGVTSVAVEDTDVLSVEPVVAVAGGTATLSSEGVRRLIGLLGACVERASASSGGGRVGGPRPVVDERDRRRERGAAR
jgi:hypothetical protein